MRKSVRAWILSLSRSPVRRVNELDDVSHPNMRRGCERSAGVLSPLAIRNYANGRPDEEHERTPIARKARLLVCGTAVG